MRFQSGNNSIEMRAAATIFNLSRQPASLQVVSAQHENVLSSVTQQRFQSD